MNIEKNDKFNNITSAMFNAYLISILKFENIEYFGEIQKSEKIKDSKIQFEKNYEFNNITSAMFNAYLISTLKFLFEKMINSIK